MKAKAREARMREAQEVIGSLLRLALDPAPLRQRMERALSQLFSLSWLTVQSKGAVFTLDGRHNCLVMIAHRGLSSSTLATCSQVAVGLCLCGRAAAEKQLIFAPPGDPRHEIHVSSPPHGHYCLPLMRGKDLLGVLNLYVSSSKANSEEEYFLQSVADTLAGVLYHHKVDEERRLLSRVVEQSPVAVMITDQDGAIEYINPHFSQVTGYQREEVMGKNPRILRSGLQSGEAYQQLWQTIAQGQKWEGELHNRRKDGSLFWERAIIAPMRGEDDAITYYVAVKEEITARKEAEERERRASQAQSVIADLLGIAILPISLHEQLDLALARLLATSFLPPNSHGTIYLQMEQGKGLTLEVQKGFPDELFKDCRSIEPGHCYCSQAVTSHQPLVVNDLAGCGGVGHAAMAGRLLISLPMESRGHLMGVLNLFVERQHGGLQEETGVFTAIATTLAAMVDRERILIAQQRAEAMERAKDAFLANISHEIRTPMNGVLGMLELLHGSGLGQKQKQMAGVALDSAKNLLSILNDLLDFTKIQAGKLQLEEVVFNLHELVESLFNQMAHFGHQQKLDLSCFIHAKVPLHVQGDPTRLRQVLQNLLSNAVKFTKRGEVALRLLPDEEECGGRISFQVCDSGIGIDPLQVGRLFQPFSQADASTTRRFGGTGLGLAICRQLVELMGGEIGVASSVGVGSTFWFTLPLVAVDWLPPKPSPALVGRRCLVVDDHPGHQAAMAGYLREMGVLPVSFAGGKQAWQHLLTLAQAGERFDFALLNMYSRGMDGIELACRIKSMAAMADTRIIIVSSMGNLADIPGDETISRYLTKPVARSDLWEALCGPLGMVVSDQSQPEVSPPLTGRVLLVEDSLTNQQVALGMLTSLGVTVEVANHGRQALELYQPGRFDIIFMDMQMPEMDGITATRQIRQQEAARHLLPVTIVAMTANVRPQDREQCLAAGMNDFLTKPVALESLRQVLTHRLNPASREEAPLPPPREATSLLDDAVLDALRQTMSVLPDGFAGILRAYLAESPLLLEKVRQGLNQQDGRLVRQSAHTLKSTSASLGATALSELAWQVESCALEERLAAVTPLLPQLEACLAQVCQALNHHLA